MNTYELILCTAGAFWITLQIFRLIDWIEGGN